MDPHCNFFNLWMMMVELKHLYVVQAVQNTPASALASSMLHRMITPMRAYRY